MQTPWGDIPVSDTHVHFFSRRFFQILGGDSSQLGFEIDDDLASRWIAELDKYGVSKAALIASIPGDEESVAAAVTAHPGRFHGYFMLNPTAPNWERGFDLGLHVPCLFPAMHRYSLHDDRVIPVLERARCVFVHCGVLTVGVRKKLGLPSPFDMRFSNPMDLHGLALRYPMVNFIIPHFGAGYFREALMLADLCPNIYLDTSSSNSWMKYQPSSADLKSVFATALVVAGANRLLFGTDSSFFPRGWQKPIFDEQISVLRELGVESQDAAAILGGNHRRLMASAA